MVVCNECIKNVLNRIFLEGVARFGEPPQIYWDAIHALEQLDKTCLTINSTSDPNSPIGWRRNNYPILVVGKKNNKLKFSYTKKGLNNGIILITVEEVADVYGNILTENNNNNNIKNMKQTIRLNESDLHRMIKESVKEVLSELDWKTYTNAARKREEQGRYGDANRLRQAATDSLQNKYTRTTDANDFQSFGNGAHLNAYVDQDGGTIRDERFAYDGGKNFGKNATETHRFGNDGSYSKNFKGTADSSMSNRSQEYQNNLNSIGNDMQRYYRGQSKYTTGKGWD